MAGLPAKLRIQSTDVKAAAMWGVAAATGALYLVQVTTYPLSLSVDNPDFQFSVFLFCVRMIWLLTFVDVPN